MTDHEDLCLVPLGAEVCVCDEIRRVRGTNNPWADIMVTVQVEHDEREQALAAARVEVEAHGHSKDCARWIWANRDMPCDCGRDSNTIKGELVRLDDDE